MGLGRTSPDSLTHSQAMAEQLAENYHNTWGRKKKQELEAKGEGAHRIPAQTPLHRSPLGIGSRVIGV